MCLRARQPMSGTGMALYGAQKVLELGWQALLRVRLTARAIRTNLVLEQLPSKLEMP